MRPALALAAALALGGGAFLAAPAGATPGTPEGCVLGSGTQQAHPDYNVGGTACSYDATAAGMYGGVGTYRVEVYSDASLTTLKCVDDNGTNPCPIVAGDHVKASIGANSGLLIGNATGV